ncbi:MAG: B12-binding domain-containing radical SAM protein [Elusimicrobia bacterium]|nr:B12-binding domain-containing radical SAM protein [Elusimicrobiota bacterium]
MKILLVSPCIDPETKTPEGLMIPQLSLYILEGLTPAVHEIKIVEEELENINLDEKCDLVGISCMTPNAPRTYYLSGEFRKRGKKVVLGGIHPTLLPDEALRYADSVVVGEVEGVWEQLLEDFQKGRLQKKYHQPLPVLDRYIPMRYRKSVKRKLFDVMPIMATRGCPYNCEFCCVSDIFGKKMRHVPIANIVRNLEEFRHKMYIFLDDNIIGEPNYAKELFKAIKPFKIKWGGQASVSFVHDTELMKLAADSGCMILFVGIESVSESQLKRMPKSIKKIKLIDEAIRKIKDMGIHLHTSFVFGFDGDTKAIFPETLEFLQRNKIGTASLNILTPYPGTRVYKQFKKEGRLLTTDWKYYDHSTVVFSPKNMSARELQEGEIWVKKEFSRMPSILKRLPGNLSHPLLYLSMNLGIRKNVRVDTARLPNLASEIFGSRTYEK